MVSRSRIPIAAMAASVWDEAGRSIGLYREGKPNENLLQQSSIRPRPSGPRPWMRAAICLCWPAKRAWLQGRSGSAFLRYLEGRRLLYTIAQMANRIELFAFEEASSQIARPVGRPLDKRWNDNGEPVFGIEKPDIFAWPEDCTEIGRVVYLPETDTLYVSGYAKDKPAPAWGLIGAVLDRYDDRTTAAPKHRWRIDLPVDNVNYTAEESGLPVAIDYGAAATPTDHKFFHTVPALENNTMVLRCQQACVDKLLSYSLKHPHVLYCMNNETGEPVAWSDFRARCVRAQAAQAGKRVEVAEMRRHHDISATQGTLQVGWLEIVRSAWQEPQTVAAGASLGLQTPGKGHWAVLLLAD
ncbi:hypothetical protein [Anaerobaca lacustris]|uniref:Uncharacterized protein n=1 Tax=Anaerobaca lacustris TaxID=3044600 RepID=A0AAW6U1R1_9BACT|nr:hypothetical protein [Sedimentisphaerales bacterium M17dextr]